MFLFLPHLEIISYRRHLALYKIYLLIVLNIFLKNKSIASRTNNLPTHMSSNESIIKLKNYFQFCNKLLLNVR